MSEFKSDFKWQMQFMPTVKSILGQELLTEASFHQDTKQNTDIVLSFADAIGNGCISCRIRRSKWAKYYGTQFTLRAVRHNGTRTEIDKAMDGWGDLMFYGIAAPGDSAQCGLARWGIGRWKVFREWYKPGKELERRHASGGNVFLVFDWRQMPTDFVLASHNVEGGVNTSCTRLDIDVVNAVLPDPTDYVQRSLFGI